MMNDKIITYLETREKVTVNELAEALEMTGAKKFPKLIKEISTLESQGKLRFNDAGMLSLRKKQEKKKKLPLQGFFEQIRLALAF